MEVETWKEGLLLSHVLAFFTAAYCYYFIRNLPLGFSRFISCIPVVALYAWVPHIFNRSTHLVGLASLYCILTWIGSFKLLLLCWGLGPGSESSSFARFAIAMTYPIHITRPGKVVKRVTEPYHSSSWWAQVSKSEIWYMLVFRSLLKLMALTVPLRLLVHRDEYPTMIVHLLTSLQLYLFASTVLEVFAAVANAIFGVTLEPHFDNPFAAASLAEFWGRRWNLLVSNCLRETVYNPVLTLLERNLRVSKEQRRFDVAKLVAMQAAFLVSGLMHELLVYYASQEVTWEMMSFFVVQGVAVSLEGAWKLYFPKMRPPRVVATILTLGFAFLSAHYLFWPPVDGVSEQVAVEMRQMLHFSPS